LIYPGDVLVILPGQKDVEEVRQYRAVYVDKVVRVEDFARMYDLTVDELRYYNSLGAGDLIPADRWLVVPHQEGSPPPTPAPTLAATIDFSHAITPRFGPSGEYVLHMVRPGENISLIAERYHTTVQVLQAANGFTGLNPGDVLVVLPGRSDPEGVRMFETFLVSEDIAVEDLAAQMRVFESDLLWFNQLEEGSIVPAGQWVIYPKPVEEEK
jgi:LysM repeat protein